MQNLCLAAHALGLGTVIIGLFDHKKVEEILGIPQEVEVVAMTPLGYPTSGGGAPKRKYISEFVFHDKYGRKYWSPNFEATALAGVASRKQLLRI